MKYEYVDICTNGIKTIGCIIILPLFILGLPLSFVEYYITKKLERKLKKDNL
jgi:hypothetical protein